MPLSIKDIDISMLSQGMRQYAEFKLANMDKIVFFRLGDFYEMFFDDAITASKVLNLTLTGKDCGLSERAPMCGVPFHACDGYIKSLVAAGYKVVICEQMEDPAQAKGIVKRDIIRIVTPGTLTDSSMLDEGANNWLCSIYIEKDGAALCFADMSTGSAHIYNVLGKDMQEQMIDRLSRFGPVEIICGEKLLKKDRVEKYIRNSLGCQPVVLGESEFDPALKRQDILEQFSASSFEDLGLENDSCALKAVAALCGYIKDTQRVGIGRFSGLETHDGEQIMQLGYTARTNLEIKKTIRGSEKKGTLLWVLDKTRTAMGRRQLKVWLDQPLISPYKIIRRLDAVEEFTKSGSDLSELGAALDGVYDLERLMTRVMYKTALYGDLKSLSSTALRLPGIKSRLSTFKSPLLNELNGEISTLQDISDLIESAIADDPPSKDEGVIRDGFNEELDGLRKIRTGAQEIIDGILEKEKERTGIRNLKVGYNRVFGYYIEVTRSFYDMVPSDYIRKQTLANCERFITEDLKNAEERILGASEKIAELESRIFAEVRDYVGSRLSEVQATATALGSLDVLMAFAETAIENNYTKPDIAIDGVIDIRNGRHPVVEKTLEDELFVPNDTYLDLSSNRMFIITGPNMSGKSTYMRQVALIVLMAQIGSFVPADYAKISVVDQIFTRVGASDDLSAGQSTFMVEMSEVAEIVRHATKNSLVILDEVGRGTSTSDGISIARSVAEYILDPKILGCKTLFATHYHELVSLENELSGVLNYSVAVKKVGDAVRFLRKIVRGGADESYGIEVAKLAGLPKKITERAKEILSSLDTRVYEAPAQENQMTFDIISERNALDRLKRTNIDELSDEELRELIADIIKEI